MKLLIAAALLSAVAVPALAQTGDAPPPLCTDRPTKSNAPCTVPAGDVQLETDIVNWTVTTGGGRSDVVLYTNPTLKLGLTDGSDLEVNWAPYVTSYARTDGSHDTIGGVGDVYVRFKQRLTGADGTTEIALIPFVKPPTARRGIGNRAWEGGLSVPVSFSLPQSFTLTFSPEADLLEDGDGHGKHAQLVGTINLARPIAPKLTAYAELWTAQNIDPAGTIHQYSADAALAYALTPLVQLDAGANFGLNHATPDAQLYFGVATRF